jgi:anti-anti-sigma factor
MSQVDFVASIGVRMFVTAARSLRQKQARLAVYGATPSVQQVFETVALGQVMSICATEAEALAAVGAPSS